MPDEITTPMHGEPRTEIRSYVIYTTPDGRKHRDNITDAHNPAAVVAALEKNGARDITFDLCRVSIP